MKLTTWQVIDHGEDGSQYFPGCGLYGTEFTRVVTGIGDTGQEALNDALEQLAANSVDWDGLSKKMAENLYRPNKSALASIPEEEREDSDWHHYVSIRYNVEEEP